MTFYARLKINAAVILRTSKDVRRISTYDFAPNHCLPHARRTPRPSRQVVSALAAVVAAAFTQPPLLTTNGEPPTANVSEGFTLNFKLSTLNCLFRP